MRKVPAFSGKAGAFLFVFRPTTSTFDPILKSCGIAVSCRQIIIRYIQIRDKPENPVKEYGATYRKAIRVGKPK